LAHLLSRLSLLEAGQLWFARQSNRTTQEVSRITLGTAALLGASVGYLAYPNRGQITQAHGALAAYNEGNGRAVALETQGHTR
jgi:hypothetical protein